MEEEETVRQIRDNIAADRLDLAGPQIGDLMSRSSDRPLTVLTCASLYLTLGNEDGFREAVSRISGNLPDDPGMLCDIAEALLALDVPGDALAAAERAGDSDRAKHLKASALHELMRDTEALDMVSGLESDGDVILRAYVLASLKRFDEAVSSLDGLVKRKDYKACRAYISILVKAKRDKEAMKYARERAKGKDADGSALMAQYQWIDGNITAAGAYASKAIKADETHVGAMEFLGYALASKGEFRNAKIVAGAINEREPGNPAAFRIISLCNRG